MPAVASQLGSIGQICPVCNQEVKETTETYFDAFPGESNSSPAIIFHECACGKKQKL